MTRSLLGSALKQRRPIACYCCRPAAPPPCRLRVFMYDLPQAVAMDLGLHDPNYVSYKRFLEIFLRDWTVR